MESGLVVSTVCGPFEVEHAAVLGECQAFESPNSHFVVFSKKTTLQLVRVCIGGVQPLSDSGEEADQTQETFIEEVAEQQTYCRVEKLQALKSTTSHQQPKVLSLGDEGRRLAVIQVSPSPPHFRSGSWVRLQRPRQWNPKFTGRSLIIDPQFERTAVVACQYRYIYFVDMTHGEDESITLCQPKVLEIDRRKKIVACSFLSNIGSSSHLFVAVLLHSNETPFQKSKATIKSHLHIYRYDPGSKALVLFKESEQFIFDRELHSLTAMCSQADPDALDAGSSALDHFNKKRRNKDVNQTLLLRGEDITALNVKIEDNHASIQIVSSSLQLPCPTRDETNANILRRSILPVIPTGSNSALLATLEGDVYLLRASCDPKVSSTSLKFLTKDPVFSRPTGIYSITDDVFIIAPSHGQHGRLLRLSKDKESLVQIPSDSSCLNKWTSIADVAVVSSLAGQTEIVAISPFEQDSLRVLRREATFDQLITADLGYNNIANGCWVLNISSESFSQRSLVFLFLLSFSSATRALVLQCNSNRLLSSSSESNGEESERADEDTTFLEDISEWIELETEGPTIYSSLMEVLPKTSGSHRQVVLQISRNSIRAIETLHILGHLSKDSTDQDASSSSSQTPPSLLRFHTTLHNSSITAVFSLSYHLVVAMTDLSGENTIILYTMVYDEEGSVLELLERSRRTWPSEITSLLIENVCLNENSSSSRKFILFVGTYNADVSILSLDFGEHLQTLHHLDIKTLMKDSQDQEHDLETNIPNSMALCPLVQRLDDWNEAEGPPIASLSVPESENSIQVLAIGLRNGKVLFLSFHGASSPSSSLSLDREQRPNTSLVPQSQIRLEKIDSFSIGGQPVKIVSTTLPSSYHKSNQDGTRRPRTSKALLILSNSSWLLTEIFSQRTPSENSSVKHRLNMQSLTFDDPIRFAAPLNQNSLPSFSDLTRPDRNRISSSILILTSTSLSVSQLLKQINLTKTTLPILPRLSPARLDRSNSSQSIPMEDEHFGTASDESDTTSLSASSSSLSLSSSTLTKKKAPRMLKIEFLKRQRLLVILSEKSVRFIDTVEYRVVHELIPETLPFPTFIEPENLFRLFHVRDISHDPGMPAAIIFNDHILLAIAMIAPEGHSSCVQLYWLQFRSNSTVESKCLCTIDFKECIVSSVHVVPQANGWNLLIGSKMLVRKQKSRVCVFEISMSEKACIMEKKSKKKTLSTVMTISHSDNMVLMGTHDESVGLYELSQNALHFVNGDWKRRAIVDCILTPSRLIGLDAYGCVCTFKRSSVEKTKAEYLSTLKASESFSFGHKLVCLKKIEHQETGHASEEALKVRNQFEHILVCGNNGAIYQMLSIPLHFHRVLMALQTALFEGFSGMMDQSHQDRVSEFDSCGNVVDMDVLQDLLDLDLEERRQMFEDIIMRTPSLQILSVQEIEELLVRLRKLLSQQS